MARASIQVEWFNVTYRSVMVTIALSVLLLVGAGGWWYWFHLHAPRQAAGQAIERAGARFDDASSMAGPDPYAEVVDSAGSALDEARQEFAGGEWDRARVAAIRSENLSIKALELAQGNTGGARMVRFYRIEGEVRVKRAGEFSWKGADSEMVLQIGDQVKTSSSGSAQLIYFDGTLTTIKAGSLLEIRDLYEDPVTKVRRVKEKLNWGELNSSTRERNVRGSYHEVATETVAARSEEGSEFRVAYDRGQKTATFDVFDGRIEVASDDRKAVLDAGERVQADPSGALLAKESLPGVPRLISPADQRVFVHEDPARSRISLSWEPVASAGRYRLVIAEKPLFTKPLYDAERSETDAVIEGVPVGSYYWRVAAISDRGGPGPYSDARRFRVASERIHDHSDTEPPVLEIAEFVPIGAMVIVNGRTEPGATLWVDEEKVDVADDGRFYAVVRMRREGLNRIRFVAQDTAGNESELQRTAVVESY
jgi:hypothetical protein